MNKLLNLLCYAIFSIAATPLLATDLELECSCSYDIDGNSVTITASKVSNNSNGGTSGTLRLKLWATSSPYSGGSINGYIMGQYTFSSRLQGGYYFYDINQTVSFDQPPPGTYYVTLALTEYNGQDYIIDYVTFDGTIQIGGGGNGGGSGNGSGGSGGLELTCGCSYEISGSSLNLIIDRVSNNRSSGTSGSLKLMLWATTSPYYGGELTGYKLGEYALSSQLEGGYYFYDINRTVSYNAPPEGTYYLTLVLTEYNNGQDYIQDYVNFNSTLTVGNGGSSSSGFDFTRSTYANGYLYLPGLWFTSESSTFYYDVTLALTNLEQLEFQLWDAQPVNGNYSQSSPYLSGAYLIIPDLLVNGVRFYVELEYQGAGIQAWRLVYASEL